MATYNGERYLREQLYSFSKQHRLPDELVVCDDGSSDATVSILQEFAVIAPFEVRIVQNEKNMGFVRNFEKALSLCSGDVIFLSDQDDVWFPEKIKLVGENFAQDSMVKAIINDMLITDSELNRSNATQLGNIRASGFGEQRFIAGCCTAVRSEFLRVLFPFPADDFAHDSWIGDMAVALRVRRILDSPLQLYRRHGSNESQWLLSEPRRISKIEVLWRSGLSSPIDGWKPYLKRLSVMRDRICDKQSEFEKIGLLGQIDGAIKWIEEEQSRYKTRMHLLSLPRYRRWLSVIAFWGQGGYRRFAGWKSAVKDMIRP